MLHKKIIKTQIKQANIQINNKNQLSIKEVK